MGTENSLLCVPMDDVSLCNNLKHHGDETERSKQAKKEYFRNHVIECSKENKAAITCAHLIGSIIQHFFQSIDNRCDQIDKYSTDKGIDIKSILENILIIGSMPRNYLLKRKINSIDIAVNTRELSKLQLLHLRNHHNTEKSQNSNCILWKLYQNKFKEKDNDHDNNNNEVEMDENMKKKYEYIATSDYILNAHFIVDYILKQHISSSLRDKLSIHRDEETKIYQIMIIDEMLYPKYDSYDLDGQCFSIFDITDKINVYQQLFGTISTEQRLQKLVPIHSQHRVQLKQLKTSSTMPVMTPTSTTPDDHDEEWIVPKHHPSMPSEEPSISLSFSTVGSMNQRLNRLDSLPVFKLRINDNPMDIVLSSNVNKNNKSKKHSNLLPIQLPFYEIKLRQAIKSMAFSIDTLLIKLSDVLGLNRFKEQRKDSFENIKDEYKDAFDSNLNGVYNDDVIISYDWFNKIKNGMESYNAKNDFKKKILTHPHPEDALKCHGASVYFWKLIRFGVLLNSWSIDKTLIQLTKQNYNQWLLDEKYWNKYDNVKQKKNYEIFVDMMFNQNICAHHSLKQYQRMMALFAMLDVHGKLIKIMSTNTPFRNRFIQSINNLNTSDKDKILELFSNQGYITDHTQIK